MTHPSFELTTFGRPRVPRPAAHLQEGLAERLTSLARRKCIGTASAALTARVLVSLAHDWALWTVFSPGTSAHRERELKEMVDLVWEGLRAR
jgi:hypothetical protein